MITNEFVHLEILSDLHGEGFLKNPGHAGGQGDWPITDPSRASSHVCAKV